MNIHQSRQPRKIMNPKEAAEALFAKRAAPAVVSAPRILEDVKKPVVVETAKRKKALSCRPSIAASAPNKVADSVLGAIDISQGDIKSDVQVITPETARFFRDNFHFDRQRKISAANVERLASEMKAGRFIPGTQVYLCSLPGGSLVIINGNHTLEAVHASGVPQVMTITKKRVADINEAGRLYAVFDIHKARTWVDSLKATGIADTSDKNVSKILSAIGVIENKFEQSGYGAVTNSRLGRIERMGEYTDAAKLLFSSIVGATSESGKFIRRAAILAVVLATFRYQPSLAAEFWRSFAMDEGLVEGMPERALLGYLRTHKNTTGAAGRKLQVRAATLAWNAKFRGDDISVVKPGAMASFYLLGTPWSKGLNATQE